MKLTAVNLIKAIENDDIDSLFNWIESDRRNFDKIISDEHKNYYARTMIKILNTPRLRHAYLAQYKINYMTHSECTCIMYMLSTQDINLSLEINKHKNEIREAIFSTFLLDEEEFLYFVGRNLSEGLIVISFRDDLKYPLPEMRDYSDIYCDTNKDIKIAILTYIINHPQVFQRIINKIEDLSTYCEWAGFVGKEEYAKQAIEMVLGNSKLKTRILDSNSRKDMNPRSIFISLINKYAFLTEQDERDISEVTKQAECDIAQAQHAIKQAEDSIKQTKDKIKEAVFAIEDRTITLATASLKKKSPLPTVIQQSVFKSKKSHHRHHHGHKSHHDADAVAKPALTLNS